MATLHKYVLFGFLSFLFFIPVVYCQTSNYENLIKQFLIDKGELKKNDKASFYAFELLTSNKLNDNSFGIYRIGTFSDHGLSYLFLLDKNRNKVVFLDFMDLSKTLKCVLTFIDDTTYHLSDSEKLSYLRNVIKICESNKNAIPWQ